jgi:hypothetical protein
LSSAPGAAILCAAILLARPLPAQPHFALGGEFQVNTYTLGVQSVASVAAAGDGGFIVAWQSGGQDGSGAGVFARRFSSAGIAIDAEFQINSTTVGDQTFPVTTAGSDGRFVVVWRGDDGDDSGLFGQLFSPLIARVGGEFQVNTVTSGFQLGTSAAMDAEGRFLVVWISTDQPGSPRAQRFASDGQRIAGEFQLNTFTGQYGATMAGKQNGDFVLVSGSPDGSSGGVFAQLFSSSGAEQSARLQVNVSTLDSQAFADVATEADGDFVVAWASGVSGPDPDVLARRFSSNGDARGGEFLVNTHTALHQLDPQVAMGARGDFVVVWTDAFEDGSGNGVFARSFSRDGVAQGGEFQVNSHTEGLQSMPSAASGGGRTIVTWSQGEIFAQRFAKPIAFDVDGDGAVAPLTDAILALRYTFGFRGATLVTEAVNLAGCTRCDPASIELYLDDATQ